MIWPIATNPILSLLKRSSEKLIHTLLTKFSPSKFSRSSFCLYKSRPKIPFVEYEFLQSQKKKFVIHQTRLQINIFFFFLSFKKEKKTVADAWTGFSWILCCKFVCGECFHLLERLLKIYANDYSSLLTRRSSTSVRFE